MLVNMGGALSSLLGGAVVSAHDGDQSELELLMIINKKYTKEPTGLNRFYFNHITASCFAR